MNLIWTNFMNFGENKIQYSTELKHNVQMTNIEFRKHLANLMHDTAGRSSLISGKLGNILLDDENNTNLTKEQREEFKKMISYCRELNKLLDNYYLTMKEAFPIEKDKPKKA